MALSLAPDANSGSPEPELAPDDAVSVRVRVRNREAFRKMTFARMRDAAAAIVGELDGRPSSSGQITPKQQDKVEGWIDNMLECVEFMEEMGWRDEDRDQEPPA